MLGRQAEGVLQSLCLRVLDEGDTDVDAPLASAVGWSPPPRSLTPPRPPLSDQRGCAARGCSAAQIVLLGKRDRRRETVLTWPDLGGSSHAQSAIGWLFGLCCGAP